MVYSILYMLATMMDMRTGFAMCRSDVVQWPISTFRRFFQCVERCQDGNYSMCLVRPSPPAETETPTVQRKDMATNSTHLEHCRVHEPWGHSPSVHMPCAFITHHRTHMCLRQSVRSAPALCPPAGSALGAGTPSELWRPWRPRRKARRRTSFWKGDGCCVLALAHPRSSWSQSWKQRMGKFSAKCQRLYGG